MSTILNLAEAGYLPDGLVRIGIKRLLQKRLEREGVSNFEATRLAEQDLVDQLKSGPLAVEQDKANQQHYEIPAEFFSLVLGERRKYSACYWSKEARTLGQAEIASLEQVCERAGLRNGMQILELGCGWGSLTLWMAEHYPDSQILAVSNSRPQKEFILAECQRRGLRNVEIQTADVSLFKPEDRFDRIVSIEMFEHFRNHAELLSRIETWLKDDGKLFVHIFCHKNATYLFEPESEDDWMARYFFSGGIMPSDSLLLYYQDRLQVERHWRLSGDHYAKTAHAWLENLDRNKSQVLELFARVYGVSASKKWLQRWRIFFLSCEELFAFNSGNEWWVSHYLFSKRVH